MENHVSKSCWREVIEGTQVKTDISVIYMNKHVALKMLFKSYKWTSFCILVWNIPWTRTILSQGKTSHSTPPQLQYFNNAMEIGVVLALHWSVIKEMGVERVEGCMGYAHQERVGMKSMATGDGQLYCILLGHLRCDKRCLSNQKDSIPEIWIATAINDL